MIASSLGTSPVPSQVGHLSPSAHTPNPIHVGHFIILNTAILEAYCFQPYGDCAVLLRFVLERGQPVRMLGCELRACSKGAIWRSMTISSEAIRSASSLLIPFFFARA